MNETLKKKVKAIPDGYHTVTPYLSIKNATAAIKFYKKAFGAIELMRMTDPNSGKIGHAEIRIGDSIIMMADEFPEMGCQSPQTLKGTPVSLMIYVKNVDVIVQQAVAAGAKLLRPVEDKFYGDRSGQLEDPFGHVWSIATHIEDVPLEEVRKRAAAAFGKRNSDQ